MERTARRTLHRDRKLVSSVLKVLEDCQGLLDSVHDRYHEKIANSALEADRSMYKSFCETECHLHSQEAAKHLVQLIEQAHHRQRRVRAAKVA